MSEDNREFDLKFADIFAELHALRVIVNEAFSILLARDADPANAVATVRKHLT